MLVLLSPLLYFKCLKYEILKGPIFLFFNAFLTIIDMYMNTIYIVLLYLISIYLNNTYVFFAILLQLVLLIFFFLYFIGKIGIKKALFLYCYYNCLFMFINSNIPVNFSGFFLY